MYSNISVLKAVTNHFSTVQVMEKNFRQNTMLEKSDKSLKSRQKEYYMHHITQQYIHTAICFTHLKLYCNATILKSKASTIGKARIKITMIHMGNTKGNSNAIENHPNEQKWLGVRVSWSQTILVKCSEGKSCKKTYVKRNDALF